MNSIIIRVTTDRKTALLAGRILGETEDIAVSPDTMGAEWPRLVNLLNMQHTPPTLHAKIIVNDATPEAVRAELEKVAAEEQEEERAKVEATAKWAAQYTAEIEAIEAAVQEPLKEGFSRAYPIASGLWEMETVRPDITYWSESLREYVIPAYYRALPSTGLHYSDCGDAYGPLKARLDAAMAKHTAEVTAANAAALESALPALRAKREAQETEAARLKAEQEAATKAANAIKYAERLESGKWTKDTGSYNERRYGAWWVATVDFSSGAKGDYTFGESTGSWGKSGMLSVDCAPGDFIAYGQKDLRNPSKSDHTILRMRADGSMEDMGSKADAYKVYRASQKAVTA